MKLPSKPVLVVNIAVTIAGLALLVVFAHMIFTAPPKKEAGFDPWSCTHSTPGATICIKDAAKWPGIDR
jgi:hypothetical protein